MSISGRLVAKMKMKSRVIIMGQTLDKSSQCTECDDSSLCKQHRWLTIDYLYKKCQRRPFIHASDQILQIDINKQNSRRSSI